MNVYNTTQEKLFKLGVELSTSFLEKNLLRVPTYFPRVIPTARPPSGSYGCGVYLPQTGRILVNPEACARPSNGRTIRKWSFPGYTTDRTPVGVVAHETGHRVDHMLRYPSDSAEWVALVRKGKITSYEPNSSEAFAETLRVYILNPALLLAISKTRHDFISRTLGLSVRDGAPTDPIAQLRAWCATEEIQRAACNKARITQHVDKTNVVGSSSKRRSSD